MRVESKNNAWLKIRRIQAAPIKIFLPVLAAVALLAVTFFWLVPPRMEAHLMDRKREMIRALTEVVWNTVQHYADQVRAGTLTLSEAQQRAIALLRSLRYGPDGKDYFWVNDMHPRMVMHPYRPDLEGQDTTNFTDPTGKHLFLAFIDTARREGAGFVDYQWQWQDNPDKIVTKISYVKEFTPWGWIIGTGVYVEDVRSQIGAIVHHMSLIFAVILMIVTLLVGYVVWEGAGVESRRKKAQNMANLQQEQLFQAAKMASLGTLVSGVAHEINNPITSVLLNIQVFEKFFKGTLPILDAYCAGGGHLRIGGMDYDGLRERMPQLLLYAREGVTRVKQIVGDLKDFAGQRASDVRDAVDLNKVAQKAIALVEHLIKKNTDTFEVNLAPQMPAITGNSQRLEQVVMNLLVNACQALTNRREGISVTTGVHPEEGSVWIEVRDTGAGMAPDVLERITDPFFTTRRDRGGIGLGLSISDTIVRDHGGRLSFVSREGEGTAATLTLPSGPATSAGKRGDIA
ncbi:MAG: cache domain-containing protein [Desulfatitalea sp.]